MRLKRCTSYNLELSNDEIEDLIWVLQDYIGLSEYAGYDINPIAQNLINIFKERNK